MNKYPIKIDWDDRHGEIQPWNELCAVVIEKFGLPGGRYTTEVSNQHIIFYFKEPEDALMAKLTLGDTSGTN